MPENERPSILFLAHQPSGRGSNGGMESATRIFEELSTDFNWTLVTNQNTMRTARWLAKGANVIYFNYSDGAGRWKQRLELSKLALTLVLNHRPDIVHANDLQVVQPAIPFVKILRRPLIYTIRGTKAEGETYGAIWHLMRRYASTIVTLSEEMREIIAQELSISKEKLYVINSMVDLQEFRPVGAADRRASRARKGIRDGEVALGVVAAVVHKKGQLELLHECIDPIIEACPNVRLFMIGDYEPTSNNYAKLCEEAAANSRFANRVTFTGLTDNASCWIRALDILLVPSRVEGLARCMIEAMACGIPVVSFDVCSAREMLKSTNSGLVVEQADWRGFIDATVSLATNADLRRRMGSSARAAAEERFNPQAVAESWRELYWKSTEAKRRLASHASRP